MALIISVPLLSGFTITDTERKQVTTWTVSSIKCLGDFHILCAENGVQVHVTETPAVLWRGVSVYTSTKFSGSRATSRAMRFQYAIARIFLEGDRDKYLILRDGVPHVNGQYRKAS